MISALNKLRLRLSIRSRFFILSLLLTILPFLAYRFAIDLHRIMLTNQAIVQKQTVENLALILANRTDLWALQIQSGKPTHLSHLNLKNSVLWVVNEFGQTTYVVGALPSQSDQESGDVFTATGKLLIKTLATFLPYSLPYPYPQSENPEKLLITKALTGQTFQQYRMNSSYQPISLMSATPLLMKGQIIGTLVLEERMENLFSESLNYFYRLIGIGSLIFLFVLLGAMIYTASLSNRILRLDDDVKKTFHLKGRLTNLDFPDCRQRYYRDELSDLRHHIYEMLRQLGSYERYLKQLPKTLRHELHNPLNRLSMSLSLLEENCQHSQLDYAKHALAQLKQIISSLSEATSIEDSLHIQQPEAFPIGLMLSHYFENVQALHPEYDLVFDCQIGESEMVMGDGFMIEQLLDKIISNAKDFSDKQLPIHAAAFHGQDSVFITIENSGPLLPEGYEEQIFDGMTSIRKMNQDDQAHLGLGLHIAKLITDYHGGTINAENVNRMQNQAIKGVRFQIELPLITNK